jgi:hypothetical protein
MIAFTGREFGRCILLRASVLSAMFLVCRLSARAGTLSVIAAKRRILVLPQVAFRLAEEVMTVERTLRLMAGTFVLAALAVGYWVSPYWSYSPHLSD